MAAVATTAAPPRVRAGRGERGAGADARGGRRASSSGHRSGGEGSLEARVTALWRRLVAEGAAACLVCGTEASAGAPCPRCGSELS
jgi:hypothetical protein